MLSPFNKVKHQLKCLFPTAPKLGIDAINCILNQCCVFDPCDSTKVVFKSSTYIDNQLCITLTINGVDVTKCTTILAGSTETITTMPFIKTGMPSTPILTYLNEAGTLYTVSETVTTYLPTPGKNYNTPIGVYFNELSIPTTIAQTLTELSNLTLTGNILSVTYRNELENFSTVSIDLSPLIPIPVVYTSSQGVSKIGNDFRFGDVVVAGTGLSATPLTSNRDITGDFRLSFKNKNILLGSDNTQDDSNAKLKVISNAGQTTIFEASTTILDPSTNRIKALVAYNDGNLQLGHFNSFVGTMNLINHQAWFTGAPVRTGLKLYSKSPTSLVTSPQTPSFTIDAGGTQLLFLEEYACIATKYLFQNTPAPNPTAPATPTSTFEIASNISHLVGFSGSSVNTIHSLFKINGFNSQSSSVQNPVIKVAHISGGYIMPFNYTGKFTHLDIDNEYNRATLGGTPVNISMLRGIHYRPIIGLQAIDKQYEVAFESTRGSIIIGNESGKDTLRLPSHTTVQRDAVTPLNSVTLMEVVEATNVAKIVYNSTNKNVEYHNGDGWVNFRPKILTQSVSNVNGYDLAHYITATSNLTLTFLTLVLGSVITVTFTQDATGTRTLSAVASGYTIKTAGTLSLAANSTNLITYYVAAPGLLLQTIAQPYV